MRVTKILLAAVLGLSLGYGADFSKKKDDDLVKLQGTFKDKIDDAVDLQLEIKKRITKMSEKNKPKYMEKLKEAYEKATDGWTVKELREHEKAVREGVKARVEKMSDKEKKEYGFDGAGGCPMHGGGEHKH